MYPHATPMYARTQEPTLFGLSIKDNVTYGLEREVTDEEVMEACKQANAHEFVEAFPEQVGCRRW